MPSRYNIGEHFEDFVRELVESGRYASASDVIRDSLHLLKRREEGQLLDLDHLQAEYAKGKASGTPEELDPAEFLRDLKTERRQRG